MSEKEWQSIETAPKDGTRILGYSPTFADRENGGIAVVYARQHGPFTRYELIEGTELYRKRTDGAWTCWDGAEVSSWKPTHWMPLPPPPKDTP